MLKYAKAIAANTDLETSQAFISKVIQEDTKEEIFLALLISGVGDNVFSIIRNSAADAADDFFSQETELGSRLTKVFSFLKEELLGVEELEILGCAFKLTPPGSDQSGDLYLANQGGQKSYLKRRSNLITIADENNNSQIISGALEPGDKLLLINRGLDEFIFLGKKVEGLIETSPDDLEDELEDVVMAQRNGPPLAAILIDNLSESQITATATNPAPPETLASIPAENRLSSLPHIEFDILELIEKIKSHLPKGKRERLILVGLVAFIFFGIFLLVKKHSSDHQKDQEFQGFLTSARSDLSNAENLKDSDPSSAKTSLTNARTSLFKALKIKPNDSEATDFKNQLNQEANKILKVQTVTNWPLFLDLNLIKSGFTANRLSESADQILLLDTSQKTLVELSLGQKTNNILAGSPEFGQGEEASLNGENAFVYSKDKGVTLIDTTTLKAQTVAPPDSDWGNIIDIQGFAGNFYLLDNLKNQIWKYIDTGSGFSSKSAYLNSGVVADFAGAQKFLIDSSIWVLKNNDEIDRYTAGSPDSFDIGGLDQNIQSISSFYVSSETDNIYIMDAPNSLIVVLKKSGQYVSQLVGDKFKDASDFVVDEKNKKLYLLENNKIYVIDLQ